MVSIVLGSFESENSSRLFIKGSSKSSRVGSLIYDFLIIWAAKFSLLILGSSSGKEEGTLLESLES
jgi:hypothetical protein